LGVDDGVGCSTVVVDGVVDVVLGVIEFVFVFVLVVDIMS
jgi:hypothetical protein